MGAEPDDYLGIFTMGVWGVDYLSRLLPAPVNHNTGGADNLAYKTAGGSGIEGADVIAYITKDYDEGRTGPRYMRGWTTTDSNGRWDEPMFLDAGDYTFLFNKPGSYGPDTDEETVAAIGEIATIEGGISVDHNTNTTDNLRYVDEDGQGVDNVDIYAYLTTDFDAGDIGESYVKAFSRTRYDGRWQEDMGLAAGDYTICFNKQGEFKTMTQEVTVS